MISMQRTTFRSLLGVVLFLFVAGGIAAARGGNFAGVSLKITNETVPPGGTLQMKVWLTEPKPIVKGSTRLSFGSTWLGSVQGVAVSDPNVSGAAVWSSTGVRLTFTSTTSTYGTSVDYPIITITTPVSPNAPGGRATTMNLDPSTSLWLDPDGKSYPQEVKSGTLTIGGTMSISNVAPGGGPVASGATVSIFGMGFDPTATVQIDEVILSAINVVSANQIDVTLGQNATMDGHRIRVKTATANATYYSYLRTTPIGSSARALLTRTDPVFAAQRYTQAYVPLSATGSAYDALAVQNPSAGPIWVTIDLLRASGAPVGSTSVFMPAYSRLVRAVAELFPSTSRGAAVRVSSTSGVQVLGLLADDASSLVVPVVPDTTMP